jgi:hypothetical protein
MKIYIDNYEPKNLSNKLDKLNKYLINSNSYVEIYSDDGIFYVDEFGIYKIIIINDDHIKYTSKALNYGFIIDNTKLYKENVTAIPLSHINTTINKYEYKIDIKSKIKLVIEGNDNQTNDSDILVTCEKNKLTSFIPNHFYFEILDKNITTINEIFNNNDLNVFLSLLK